MEVALQQLAADERTSESQVGHRQRIHKHSDGK